MMLGSDAEFVGLWAQSACFPEGAGRSQTPGQPKGMCVMST